MQLQQFAEVHLWETLPYQNQTCQVSRISRESHAFSLNSRISARVNIISRILFDLSYV